MSIQQPSAKISSHSRVRQVKLLDVVNRFIFENIITYELIMMTDLRYPKEG